MRCAIAASALSFIIMYCAAITGTSEKYGALSYVIDCSLYDSTRVLSVAAYSEIRSCGRSCGLHCRSLCDRK